jgi:S-DNA-T family DNA segregation ATPase FtsK/SpoIIIE
MAKTIKKENFKKSELAEPILAGMTRKQVKVLVGCLLILLAVGLFVSFVSFFVFGQFDQSAVAELVDRNTQVQNWFGKIGAYLADFLVYRGFGVAAFFLVKLLFLTGLYMVINLPLKKLKTTWFWDLFAMIVVAVLFGFFASFVPELGGVVGFEMNGLDLWINHLRDF